MFDILYGLSLLKIKKKIQLHSPDDQNIQQTVDAAFLINGGHDPADNGEFSDNRYAFLFAPGEYTADIPVGFYTSVYGLGDSPDDVVFNGAKGVYCEEGDYEFTVGALDTFWRRYVSKHVDLVDSIPLSLYTQYISF